MTSPRLLAPPSLARLVALPGLARIVALPSQARLVALPGQASARPVALGLALPSLGPGNSSWSGVLRTVWGTQLEDGQMEEEVRDQDGKN